MSDTNRATYDQRMQAEFRQAVLSIVTEVAQMESSIQPVPYKEQTKLWDELYRTVADYYILKLRLDAAANPSHNEPPLDRNPSLIPWLLHKKLDQFSIEMAKDQYFQQGVHYTLLEPLHRKGIKERMIAHAHVSPEDIAQDLDQGVYYTANYLAIKQDAENHARSRMAGITTVVLAAITAAGFAIKTYFGKDEAPAPNREPPSIRSMDPEPKSELKRLRDLPPPQKDINDLFR